MNHPASSALLPAVGRAAPGRAADRRLAARVGALQRAFDHVWRKRMQGLPVLNPALWVEAVDFEAFGDGEAALGVLVTPWFMNLIRLPLAAPGTGEAGVPDDWPLGLARAVPVGGETFDFIGAVDPTVGPFAMCSLFSPMFEFASQTAARATAQAVLVSLRGGGEAGADLSAVGTADAARGSLDPTTTPPARDERPVVQAAPARRVFLFGRPSGAVAR